MPLDPVLLALKEQLNIQDRSALSIEERRALDKQQNSLFSPAAESVRLVENRSIPGPAGDIPLRLYYPDGAGPLPVLIYFHGGGWALGDLDSSDPVCRHFANGAGCLVVSVEYRLAPEHHFPAGLDDCYAATHWVAEHIAEYQGDPARLAVCGESAGGNLAAAVALLARDRRKIALSYQVLIYPVLAYYTSGMPSYQENGRVVGDDYGELVMSWRTYLGDETASANPYAVPLQASDLSGLPPALIVTAEYDLLRDEGNLYAKRLREAGVSAQLEQVDSMVHGFLGLYPIVEKARQALLTIERALRQALDEQ